MRVIRIVPTSGWLFGALMLAGCASVQQIPPPPPPPPPPPQEENRPPIIVEEGSLNYTLDSPRVIWGEKGASSRKKWRLDHVGKTVTGFTVRDTARSGCGPFTGMAASIEFVIGKTTDTFTLAIEPENVHKNEPVAEAPLSGTHDGAQTVTFGTAGVGDIRRLVVDGDKARTCTFVTKEKPKLKFEFIQ